MSDIRSILSSIRESVLLLNDYKSLYTTTLSTLLESTKQTLQEAKALIDLSDSCDAKQLLNAYYLMGVPARTLSMYFGISERAIFKKMHNSISQIEKKVAGISSIYFRG